jgi:hypothetical protein
MDAGNAMRRLLIVFLILLLPTSLFAWGGATMMTMGSGGAASCATQSYDVQNGRATQPTSGEDQWAQSFTAGVTGSLYSVSFNAKQRGRYYDVHRQNRHISNLTTYIRESCVAECRRVF